MLLNGISHVAVLTQDTDPDGLEGEVCLNRPAATKDDIKPPGTPAAGYDVNVTR